MALYLIGIDIGTQGTKGQIFDADLNALATAFEESKLIQPEPGTTWQEADDIYGSVIRVIKSLTEKSGCKGTEVAAISIDSQMAGIMGIDKDGEASTYYDSWLDTRCKEYVKLVKERAEERYITLTGSPVSFTHGPKILWWKKEHPDAYNKTTAFVLPHTYVVGKICGLKGSESYFDWTHLQYSGFADNQNKVWSDELTETFDLAKEKLPRIVSPFEIVGKTTSEFAAQTGLSAGIAVAAGAGDTAASVLGAGLFQDAQILDCAGTASVLCCTVDSYSPDIKHKTMIMMRSPEDGHFFPLTYINGGGLTLRWFRDNFTGKPPLSYKTLEAECETLPPGSEGLIFIPHFTGRVFPSNPKLKGSFTGLDLRHGTAHMFRSIMEGISYEYAYYLSILRDLYPKSNFRSMTAIGGGASSELFLQIKADVLDLEVIRTEVGDTALVGSAAIAGYGAGILSDYRAAINKTIRNKPPIVCNQIHHEKYKPAAKKYLETIKTVSDLY
ncbi:MAG: FGGY family carbohydrate kinase [Treponema sp.]|nr:FGGY family carbohydrate kinase [Treponema sp.]